MYTAKQWINVKSRGLTFTIDFDWIIHDKHFGWTKLRSEQLRRFRFKYKMCNNTPFSVWNTDKSAVIVRVCTCVPFELAAFIGFVNEQLETAVFSLPLSHSFFPCSPRHSNWTASLKEGKLKLQNFHLFILTLRIQIDWFGTSHTLLNNTHKLSHRKHWMREFREFIVKKNEWGTN